jgi:AbrB family looped-hinge helix DNA binding protein
MRQKMMNQLLVSSKYQVVIPKDIRRELSIRSGQKVICVVKNGVIHLIPDKSLTRYKGFAKGVSTEELREKEDRL